MSHHGYETGQFAPHRKNLGYVAGHSLILAHGMVYKLYNENYRSLQKGRVMVPFDLPVLKFVSPMGHRVSDKYVIRM